MEDESAALPEGVPPGGSSPSEVEQKVPEETTAAQASENTEPESVEPSALAEAEQLAEPSAVSPDAVTSDDGAAAVPDADDTEGNGGASEPPASPPPSEPEPGSEPLAPVDPFADLSLEQVCTATGRVQLAALARAVPADARALEEGAFQRLVSMVEACLASAVEDADSSHMAALVETIDTFRSSSGERSLSSEPSIRKAPIWGNEQFWRSAVPTMAAAARVAVQTVASGVDTSPRPGVEQAQAAVADAAFQALYIVVEHMLHFGQVSVHAMDAFIQ